MLLSSSSVHWGRDSITSEGHCAVFFGTMYLTHVRYVVQRSPHRKGSVTLAVFIIGSQLGTIVPVAASVTSHRGG